MRIRQLVVLAICIGAALDASACSCACCGTPGQSYASGGAVFQGRVLGTKSDDSRWQPRLTFKVIKAWKGVKGGTVEVRNDNGCAYHGFAPGKEFLVYAYGTGPFYASMCSRTKPSEGTVLEMAILDVVAAGGSEEAFMRRLPETLRNDPRPGVRAEAARLLSIDAPRDMASSAAPALLRALDDKATIVRLAAIAAFNTHWGIYYVDVEKTRTIGRALIRRLSDSEPSVRRDAARALSKHRLLPETGPALRAALRVEQARTKADREVIRAIASSLVILRHRETDRVVVSLFVQDLANLSPQVRAHAAAMLETIGPGAAAAVASLARALRDPEVYVRAAAAQALGVIGSRSAIPALTAALSDASLNVVAQSALAIYRIGDDATVQAKAVPLLVRSLDKDDFDRFHVVRVLGEMGPAAHRAAPALAKTLAGVKSYQVNEIAAALGKMGPRARPAVAALVEALKDEDAVTRVWIIQALTAIDDRSPAVIQALRRALKDPDTKVRAAAASTLLQWRIPDGERFAREGIVPALIAELKAPSVEKRREAANALAPWGPLAVDAIPALILRLSDTDKWVRIYSAEALGKIGPEAAGATALLTAMLQRPEERRVAAVALGEFGVKAAAAVPSIVLLLKDSDPWTRACAAEALRKIGTPSARKAFGSFADIEIPRLQVWLADRSRSDRGEAARYLIHLAPRSSEAMDALIQGLSDADWLTRTKSAAALGALGPLAQKATPNLIRALNDRNSYVRDAAVAALRQIGTPAALKALTTFQGG